MVVPLGQHVDPEPCGQQTGLSAPQHGAAMPLAQQTALAGQQVPLQHSFEQQSLFLEQAPPFWVQLQVPFWQVLPLRQVAPLGMHVPLSQQPPLGHVPVQVLVLGSQHRLPTEGSLQGTHWKPFQAVQLVHWQIPSTHSSPPGQNVTQTFPLAVSQHCPALVQETQVPLNGVMQSPHGWQWPLTQTALPGQEDTHSSLESSQHSPVSLQGTHALPFQAVQPTQMAHTLSCGWQCHPGGQPQV